MDVLLFVAGSAGWPGGNQDRRRPPAASPRWGENVRGFWQSDGADHGSRDWRGSMTPERMANAPSRAPSLFYMIEAHSGPRVQADSVPLMRSSGSSGSYEKGSTRSYLCRVSSSTPLSETQNRRPNPPCTETRHRTRATFSPGCDHNERIRYADFSHLCRSPSL